MTLLMVDGVSASFGGLKALSDVSFAVGEGLIFGIIGPNGAGKTTLFNVVSGVYRPSAGDIRLRGERVTGMAPDALAARGLSRTFQNLQVFFRMTAAENVMIGRHLKESRNVLSHLLALRPAGRDNRESRSRALRLLDRVGLKGYADTAASHMPYGALKRLEIARALAAEPAVLLLDEPAAGCNPVETGEIERLIRDIAEAGTAVLLVEHDMRLVMRLCHRIHVLNQGRTLGEGTAGEIRRDPSVIEAYLGSHGAREAARAAR